MNLMTVFLKKLSQASMELLRTKASFGKILHDNDTLAFWKLLLSTHHYGTGSRDRADGLAKFVAVKQGGGSHEQFLADFNDRFTIVSLSTHHYYQVVVPVKSPRPFLESVVRPIALYVIKTGASRSAVIITIV